MNAITLAKQVQNVFSLPEVAVKINQVLNAADPEIAELEEIILHDPALTVKLLKVVNSPYYGLAKRVDTVSGAIAMLGLQELRNLVMGVSVTAQFDSIPGHLVDMNTFWYHSVIKGVLAKILAKHFRYPHYERFYIAGLLGSIGKLILFTQFPEKSEQILQLQAENDAEELVAEQQSFGFDYVELGSELLKEWLLPAEIWEMVRYQFDPLNDNAPQADACLLHVATKISNTIQPCRNQKYDFNTQKPEFNPGVLEHLKLTPEVIQAATSEALLYPFEILSIIQPSAMAIF